MTNEEIAGLIAKPNVAFDEWRSSLPAVVWSKFDLSAAKLGFEAALLSAERRRQLDMLVEIEKAAPDIIEGILTTPSIPGDMRVGLVYRDHPVPPLTADEIRRARSGGAPNGQ